jgi:hypothetical protein
MFLRAVSTCLPDDALSRPDQVSWRAWALGTAGMFARLELAVIKPNVRARTSFRYFDAFHHLSSMTQKQPVAKVARLFRPFTLQRTAGSPLKVNFRRS